MSYAYALTDYRGRPPFVPGGEPDAAALRCLRLTNKRCARMHGAAAAPWG